MEKKRLAKVLASAGVAARRKCEELIFDGRVSVNGEVCKIPQTLVSLETDDLRVNGKPIKRAENKVYFLLNKPTKTVCSNTVPQHGKRVIDLFPKDHRLFTVGRLDRETTGLLIVTNDGHLAQRIIHPSAGVQKEYIAIVDGDLTSAHIEQLRKGTRVEGVFVKPQAVEKMGRSKVKIVVSEGKKREVRLMLLHTGLKTLELSRTRIGNLRLGRMKAGEWRQVTLSQCERVFD